MAEKIWWSPRERRVDCAIYASWKCWIQLYVNGLGEKTKTAHQPHSQYSLSLHYYLFLFLRCKRHTASLS